MGEKLRRPSGQIMGLMGWGGRGREVSMSRPRKGVGASEAISKMGAQERG